MGQALDLLQFSDPHLFADPDGELRGVVTYASLRATIAAAMQRHKRPDAILVTGDIAQDETPGAYERFYECFSELNLPVYGIPGNHDNTAYMRAALQRPPFHYCSHLDSAGWVVVMLDSHDPGQATGRLHESELQRLQQLLEQDPTRHALLVLHHHPIMTGSAWLDTVPLTNADSLFDIVDRHANVRCILWGHVHQAMRSKRDTVLLLATPSTCNQFAPDSAAFALADKPPAYRWLRLQSDGTIASAIEWCDSARR